MILSYNYLLINSMRNIILLTKYTLLKWNIKLKGKCNLMRYTQGYIIKRTFYHYALNDLFFKSNKKENKWK